MTAVEYQDIVCVATEAGRFSTLAAALQRTGLDEVLKGAGPFTLFAPTDAAFSRLPAGLLDELLDPAASDRLAAVLRHHVVKGLVPAADVATFSAITPLQGPPLVVSTSRSGIAVGGADIITTDLDASNGVIHVVDRVLLP